MVVKWQNRTSALVLISAAAQAAHTEHLKPYTVFQVKQFPIIGTTTLVLTWKTTEM